MPPGPPGWGPPPGPRRPNNNAAIVIVIVAIVLLLIGGGAVLWWGLGLGGSGGEDRPVAVAPTVSDVPVPPTFSPPPLPSFTPFSPPDTFTPPPPPAPEYYGAIAVAHDGSVGKSWDYSTAAGARRRAMNECPRSGCKVLVVFVNGCGAVAYNPHTNRYWGGHGDTRTEAERNAISNAGGGHWITWVCTTR